MGRLSACTAGGIEARTFAGLLLPPSPHGGKQKAGPKCKRGARMQAQHISPNLGIPAERTAREATAWSGPGSQPRPYEFVRAHGSPPRPASPLPRTPPLLARRVGLEAQVAMWGWVGRITVDSECSTDVCARCYPCHTRSSPFIVPTRLPRYIAGTCLYSAHSLVQHGLVQP